LVAYDTDVADRVREQLAGEQDVSQREMFGGLAFLLHGHMAIAVSGRGGLLVRLPLERVERALSRPHTEPLVMAGRRRPGWVRVFPEGVRTKRQLSGWVRLAAGFAGTLPPNQSRLAGPPGGNARANEGPAADFDARALWTALDVQRRDRGLSWTGVATEIWEQSAVLNGRRDDHPISPSTIANMAKRDGVSCQHAVFMLRWLGRPPEMFLRGGDNRGLDEPLPAAGPDRRLRWDLRRLYGALDVARRDRGLTWAELAVDLACTPSQLTGLRSARFGTSMRLAMRVVQWLGRPAADFVYAAQW
jgi:hypothetical protein